MVSATEKNRIIRNPGYAKRLTEACNNSPHCPPMQSGRLMWINHELKRRFGVDISFQTSHRWFTGVARPREDKSNKLAQILGVDPTWLFVGVEQSKKASSWPGKQAASTLADAAAAMLEVHEAMGSGTSHTANKLRQAIEDYRKVA